MGSQRVGYDWATSLSLFTVKLFFFLKKKQKGHKTEKELWNKMANYATEKDSSQFQEN